MDTYLDTTKLINFYELNDTFFSGFSFLGLRVGLTLIVTVLTIIVGEICLFFSPKLYFALTGQKN